MPPTSTVTRSWAPPQQGVEVRLVVAVAGDELAVDYRAPGGQVQHGGGDQKIAVGEVLAVAGEQPDVPTGFVKLDAKRRPDDQRA